MPTATAPTNKGREAKAHDMSFPQALEAVMNGEQITKREWNDQTVYVALIEGLLKIHKADGSEHALLVRDADLLGTDWYVLKTN